MGILEIISTIFIRNYFHNTEIVVPGGASVVDLALVKAYSWKETSGSGYQADYFVFKYDGYVCKLERISTATYKTEINLYCGLAR